MHTDLRPGRTALLTTATITVLVAFARAATAAWQTEGVPLTPVPVGNQTFWFQKILADDAGGAFVTWLLEDPADDWSTTTFRLDVQRVNALGNRPSPWLLAGSTLAEFEGPDVVPLALVPDGEGGALHVQMAYARTAPRIQIQRIAPSGAVSEVPGWDGTTGDLVGGAVAAADAAGGVILFVSGVAGALDARRLNASGETVWGPVNLVASTSGYTPMAVIADGSGGAFFAWAMQGEWQVRVQHLDASGAIAPGWAASGVPAGDASGGSSRLRLAADGTGGVYVAWSPPSWDFGARIRMNHVLAGGTPSPGIPSEGAIVPSSSHSDELSNLIADGQGGCYLTRMARWFYDAIRLHHIGGSLQPLPGWTAEGEMITSQGSSLPVTGMVADDAGGVFVSFRNGTGPAAPRGVCAQHYGADGDVVPGWPAEGYRLSGTGEQSDLVRSGAGVIVAWTDTRLSRQGVYAQRVEIAEPTAVPDGDLTGLALEPPAPNPSRHAVSLAVRLPDARVARLDVLDVAGRRVTGLDLSGLGPGRHVIPLPEVGSLAPGLYVVQLVHAGATRRAKLMRVR